MGEGIVMEFNVNTEYPRILVISNNSFSNTNNNGKTLASFFDKYPVGNIAQLYFNLEVPNNTHYKNYFRVTDNDVVKRLIHKRYFCGKIIDVKVITEDSSCQERKHSLAEAIKKYNLPRIAREVVWKSGKWKSEFLNQWLNEFSPEIIFFCAGDSGFAYDITNYIQNEFGAKVVVYITDDYVLPRRTISPFWWQRRNYILSKMKKTLQRSDLFITISQQMKQAYKQLFGIDSILAINMTDTMKDESIVVENNKFIMLVYTGGLHYKRYLTLNSLAKSLKKYNDDLQNKQKAYLKVYSTQELNNTVLKHLNMEGASEFCGKLNPIQLKKVLNSCDIPVHVESFDQKSMESTRLSISTKIPEYLSLGKPILAIGPNQVASMEYLKSSAFCITKQDNIYSDLVKLLNDNELQKVLSTKALLKFEKNHKKEILSEVLISNILDVYKQK